MKISTEHTQQNCRDDFCFSLLAKINAFAVATDDDVHTILLRVGIDWR